MKNSILFAALLSLVISNSSQAAVVIDNLAAGTQSFSASLSGPSASIRFFGPFVNREVAFSFTSGTADSILTQFEFTTGVGAGTLNPINVTLSTGLLAPGGINSLLLGSVAPLSNSPGTQLLSVIPTLPPTLLANTLYWIHFTVPTGSSIYTIANSDAPVQAPGWNLGSTWLQDPNNPWNELNSGPLAKVRLTVDSIPEPSAMLLGGLSLLFLMKRRRHS